MKRHNLSKALYDVGKLTFAALVLGQFISTQGFNTGVFSGGLIFCIASFTTGYLIDEGEPK